LKSHEQRREPKQEAISKERRQQGKIENEFPVENVSVRTTNETPLDFAQLYVHRTTPPQKVVFKRLLIKEAHVGEFFFAVVNQVPS